MRFAIRNTRPTITDTLIALGILCLVPSGWAANANCSSSWEWSYNSKGQNPCEIAALLQGPCFGEPNFEVQQLQSGKTYASPKKDTPLRKKCGCNTIIFSLYMACTLCQSSNGTQAWTAWSQFCDNVYVTQYPFGIPQNTTVPHWTFFDYTKENKFNATIAQSVGRDPESTPSPGSSTSNSSPNATGPSQEGGDQEGSSKSNVGAIAGGVVGGAAALLVMATLLFFLHRKRRRKARQEHVIDLDPATGAQWDAMATENSYKPQRLYDPSDPSTFPPPFLSTKRVTIIRKLTLPQ